MRRLLLLVLAVGCGSSSDPSTGPDAAGNPDAGMDSTTMDGSMSDGGDSATDGGDSGAFVDTLSSNRDRLLGTYFTFLKASGSVCDLWKKLYPSDQAVYLTITHRLQGGKLGSDGSSMLFHIVKLYRLVGGQNATAMDPGLCGGGEYNRMIMSMDTKLHDTLVLANTHQGAKQMGVFDIADIPANESWRDSHDLGGPHAPFDLSDETNPGAPRGQVQFFKDPMSTLAKTALGRMDLTTLVDPLAIEMDQDYNCPHDSNPSCTYTTYGQFCFPQAALIGTDLYAQNYGAFDPTWMPADCNGK